MCGGRWQRKLWPGHTDRSRGIRAAGLQTPRGLRAEQKRLALPHSVAESLRAGPREDSALCSRRWPVHTNPRSGLREDSALGRPRATSRPTLGDGYIYGINRPPRGKGRRQSDNSKARARDNPGHPSSPTPVAFHVACHHGFFNKIEFMFEPLCKHMYNNDVYLPSGKPPSVPLR